MAAHEEQVVSNMEDFEFLDDIKSWNQMYKNRRKSSPAVEWYVSWEELRPHIMPILEGLQPSILVPACGDSSLSERLYLSGIHNITNVDYSFLLINLMKNKHKDKDGMQWLTKDILAPLQDPPILLPRSYDIVIDKGCFDCLCIWADQKSKSDEICHQYLLRVKELLRNRGKFICLTRLYLEDSIAFFCRRFWLGWKVTVQKVFPQEDSEKAVMLVIERCSGLVHDIIQVDKSLSPKVDKENKLRDKYRKRAKSKEDFERYLRDQGAESCCEVDHILPESDGDYRIIALTNDMFHDRNVDVLWVPEDHLVLHTDALTNSNHWQLKHFFSAMTEASAMLFIALSPKLQLHLQSDMQMDKIRLDLKPLLETIDPKIQVGRLKIWNKEHQNKLMEIDFLPPPQSSKPTPQISRPTPKISMSTPQISRPTSQSSSSKKESGTSSKGKEKLVEKDDNCDGKDLNDDTTVVLGDFDKVDVVEKNIEKVAHLKTSARPYDFPTFYDDDPIPYYPEPFTIQSWLHDHEEKEDRWLGEYVEWEDILPNIECPNLLKRESLRIMQSVIIGVLEYHERHGAHGRLDDWTNIVITQLVFNHNGSKSVRFECKLSVQQRVTTFDESLMRSKKREDMHNVLRILEKVVEGGHKNSELKYLGDLLFDYPYEEEDIWKTLLIKNFPAFWDGLGRAEFLVNLYFHLVSNVTSGSDLKWVLLAVSHNISKESLQGWMSRIPKGTIFEKVLKGDDLNEDQSSIGVGSGSSTSQNNVRWKKYYEGDMVEVVRYMRATLHHFRQKGGFNLDVKYVEAALSQIFENYIVEIYAKMCETGLFL